MSQVFRFSIKSVEGFIDAPSEAAVRQYLSTKCLTIEKTDTRTVFKEMSANPAMTVEVVERKKRGKVTPVADPRQVEVPGLQVPDAPEPTETQEPLPPLFPAPSND